jgi:hypothetical protein
MARPAAIPTRPTADPSPRLANEPDDTARPIPAIEPMLVIDDLATIFSCSRRLVKRMKSAGRLPAPDVIIGRGPRWCPATIKAWVDQQSRVAANKKKQGCR